jgi:hypothetical protein
MLPTSDIPRAQVAVLQRIRSEYLEMPGLRLTRDQMRRLCGLDPATCGDALETLVEMKFLCRKSDGAYVRATDGADVPRPRTAGASLGRESTLRVSRDSAAAERTR